MANFFKSKGGNGKGITKPKFFRQASDDKEEKVRTENNSKLPQDRLFWLMVFAWALPLLLAIVYSLVNLGHLPNQIPLFYSQIWGESQLGPKTYILLPSAGVLIFGLVNIFFGISFFSKDRVFAFILGGIAFLVSILSAITVFNIVNLMK